MASTDEVYVGRRFVFVVSRWTEIGDAFWRARHRFEHHGMALVSEGRVDFVTDEGPSGYPDRNIYPAPAMARTPPNSVRNTGQVITAPSLAVCAQLRDEGLRLSSLAPLADRLLAEAFHLGERVHRATRYNHVRRDGSYSDGSDTVERYAPDVEILDLPDE